MNNGWSACTISLFVASRHYWYLIRKAIERILRLNMRITLVIHTTYSNCKQWEEQPVMHWFRQGLDSDSNSSLTLKVWFRFWFQQKVFDSTPIPIFHSDSAIWIVHHWEQPKTTARWLTETSWGHQQREPPDLKEPLMNNVGRLPILPRGVQ